MIRELLDDGTPFFVSIDLGAGAGTVTAVRAQAVNRIGGSSMRGEVLNDFRLALMAYQYDFVGADGSGFDLVWSPNHGSPITPFPATYRLLEVRASSASGNTSIAGGLSGIFAPGPGGFYSPLIQPADLQVVRVGTVTSGHLVLFGLHLPGESRIAHSYTGLPDLFTATPLVP